MDDVWSPSEVSLYNTRFPIFGNVRRTNITPFPPKMTIGDYRRDDNIVESAWTLSDLSGGIGIYDATLPRDQQRYWSGDLEARYRRISLAPQITEAAEVGPFDVLIEFNERLYGTVGTAIYRWSETTGALEAALATLSDAVVDATIFDGRVWFLTANSLHAFDGVATWEHFAGSGGYETGGYAIVCWDDKLFRLRLDNTLHWAIEPSSGTLDDAANWTAAGALQLPAGFCRQLVVYFDLTGEPSIHAVTKIGAFGYDFGAGKFIQTPLTYPSTVTAGAGAGVWRGELMLPAARPIYKYNGNIIQPIGPARDDGLPSHLRGNIVQVVPGHAYFFAVINSVPEIAGTETDPDPFVDFMTAGPFDLDPFLSTVSVGAVLVSTGQAWHEMWSGDAGSSMGKGLVAAVEGTYRLWWSTGDGLFYVDLTSEMHNPLQNPTERYRRTGSLTTSWMDMGFAEMPKLGIAIEVDAEGMNSAYGTEVRFEAGYDGGEEWHEIGSVTENGRTELDLAGERGKVFRSVRLRIHMQRAYDTADADIPGDLEYDPIDGAQRATPQLKSCVFTFLRRPKRVWGWEFDLQLTQDYEGFTARDLIDRLYDLADEIEAGPFSYRDNRGDLNSGGRVIVSKIVGSETSGERAEGRYTVAVLELRRNAHAG